MVSAAARGQCHGARTLRIDADGDSLARSRGGPRHRRNAARAAGYLTLASGRLARGATPTRRAFGPPPSPPQGRGEGKEEWPRRFFNDNSRLIRRPKSAGQYLSNGLILARNAGNRDRVRSTPWPIPSLLSSCSASANISQKTRRTKRANRHAATYRRAGDRILRTPGALCPAVPFWRGGDQCHAADVRARRERGAGQGHCHWRQRRVAGAE